MKNIIGKGTEKLNKKFYFEFSFSWGYYYFSAGYLFCKKIFGSFLMSKRIIINT
ncbi:hypothetical protein KM800_00995 [Clostridium tyrobutyricum]|uniref:hypothetical protein n=1 Tax=Clostridium tyrobutyricum TaxID=1519 RepID=UPI001C385144|nr:hypothetical protein [Clostridium tyrobutyricum]MBV4417909.1 hypothetical protein [Clostridium tyrobutyricum]